MGSPMGHYSKACFHFSDSVGFAIIKARNLVATQLDAAPHLAQMLGMIEPHAFVVDHAGDQAIGVASRA